MARQKSNNYIWGVVLKLYGKKFWFENLSHCQIFLFFGSVLTMASSHVFTGISCLFFAWTFVSHISWPINLVAALLYLLVLTSLLVLSLCYPSLICLNRSLPLPFLDISSTLSVLYFHNFVSLWTTHLHKWGLVW